MQCSAAGGFISSIAKAALVADYENYPLMRPLLLVLRTKYPQYEPERRGQGRNCEAER
jgi:hypothetical protein